MMGVVGGIFASLAVIFLEKDINFSRHKRSAQSNGRARVHRHSNHESKALIEEVNIARERKKEKKKKETSNT